MQNSFVAIFLATLELSNLNTRNKAHSIQPNNKHNLGALMRIIWVIPIVTVK